MENELSKRNYLNIITKYVDSKRGVFSSKKYTYSDVANYCLSETDILSPGDLEYIESLVKTTLDSLVDYGYIKKDNKGFYQTICHFKHGITIENDSEPEM